MCRSNCELYGGRRLVVDQPSRNHFQLTVAIAGTHLSAGRRPVRANGPNAAGDDAISALSGIAGMPV